jgi:hypothetical protein
MCTTLSPPHLLLLHHPSANDLIHRRLSKRRGDCFTAAIPVTEVECPRIVYTDLDTSWFLSRFGEGGPRAILGR